MRRTAGGILLALLLGSVATYGAPYDLVPRGDWSYDALARWAARGLLLRPSGNPVEGARARPEDARAAGRYPARAFFGDEPLTREAMAALVADLAARPEVLPSGDRPLLLHLVREYGPELRRLGRDPVALRRAIDALAQTAQPHETGRSERPTLPVAPSPRRPVAESAPSEAWATGFLLGRLGHSSDDGVTLRGVYRAAGLVSLNPRLLGSASVTNSRQLTGTDAAAFPELERAVVLLHTRFADWELGKASRRWGPGQGGTMLLSDDAPALFQLRGKKQLSLGFLGRGYTFEQLAATLNDSGGRRYVVARRLSRMFGRRFGASISEAVKTSSTKGLPLALVLPLYLYADLTFDDVRNSEDVNYIAGADVWYAPSQAVRIYTDFVLDDITAPSVIGDYSSVPRKIGVLFGVHLPRLNRERTDVRLEWTLTDGEDPGNPVQEGGTYVHRNRSLSWFHDGLPLGHRMGQNRRGPFARVRHRFGERITVIGEWEDERQWRPTPAVGDRRRAVLYTAYDLRMDRWIAFRLERTGGALGRDTLGEVQIAISF